MTITNYIVVDYALLDPEINNWLIELLRKLRTGYKVFIVSNEGDRSSVVLKLWHKFGLDRVSVIVIDNASASYMLYAVLDLEKKIKKTCSFAIISNHLGLTEWHEHGINFLGVD